jgi:hypothetical protein
VQDALLAIVLLPLWWLAGIVGHPDQASMF